MTQAHLKQPPLHPAAMSTPGPSSHWNDHEEATPLDEYMEERSFDTTLGSPLAMDFDATLGRSKQQSRPSLGSPPASTASLLDASTRQRSQSIDRSEPIAGPSRLPRPPRTPSGPRENEFAERFKYLVATSGLLEKTQLTNINVPPSTIDSHNDASSVRASESEDTGPDTPLRDRVRQPDILAALAVLIAALVKVLGIRAALIPMVVIGTGATMYAVKQRERPRESEPTPIEEAPADETVEKPKTGHDRVVQELEHLLCESKNLDQSISLALQVLATRPDDTEHEHELRIALHRLFDDTTDSVAAATSSLTPMADRNELAVLGEMYKVQTTSGQRRRRPSSSDDESPAPRRPRAASSAASLTPDMLKTALLSPRERAIARTPLRGTMRLAASPFDPNDKFTKLPERISRHKRMSWSTDWNVRSPLFKSGHESRFNDEETAMSTSSTDSSVVPASIPDDKFVADERMTSIPDGREASFEEISPPSSKSPSPYTPKRASPLAQALARLEGPERRQANPYISLQKQPASQSPFRRSLQDIPYLPSTPLSSQEKAANLAIARASASMSTDKRRSLQIPMSGGPAIADFTREQTFASAGADLARTRSLDHSERALLQRPRPLTPAAMSRRVSPSSPDIPESPGLRPLSLLSDRAGTPARLRRGSLLFPDRPQQSELGLGTSSLRQPRPPVRVPSVSPLTLGGLKAACLGVHLKRRRMACCLLGLHFDEPIDSEYWEEVSMVLRNLAKSIIASRGKVDVLRADAEREATAASVLTSMAGPPVTPPRGRQSVLSRGTDFAPRDSAEQAVLGSVDEVQRTLARVWARCEDIRAGVAAGDDMAGLWADVRVDIGGMLRHVDRGRAAIDVESSSMSGEEYQAPLPEFVKAWTEREPSPGPEEIERLVDEEDETTDDSLPPPGLDEVFEGVALPAVQRQRSTMSRDERIALTKEARARGVTLAQLTAKSDPEQAAAVEREIQERELREASGQMVAELEGMFGAIRKRKGME